MKKWRNPLRTQLAALIVALAAGFSFDAIACRLLEVVDDARCPCERSAGEGYLICNPRVRAHIKAATVPTIQIPPAIPRCRKLWRRAPQDRPHQRGYLCPDHAMLDPVHRISNVVQRVRQRECENPAGGAAIIPPLPPGAGSAAQR